MLFGMFHGLPPLTADQKGIIGENIIYDDLKKVKGWKAFLPNCYLPKPDGETTEVDLIFLHETGIYVFESKNYQGWIFGSENQKLWTQSLTDSFGNVRTHKFYNPLWQNETHIQCLMDLLQDDAIPYYSYIVFGDHCELKDIYLSSSNHHVTYWHYLLDDVMTTTASADICLTPDKMKDIYQRLLPYANVSSAEKQRHIENLWAKRYPVVQPDGTWSCPLCGGVLVKRVARRGSRAGKTFWGCSNYPKCKFIYNQ